MSNPKGINQYTKGGGGLKKSTKNMLAVHKTQRSASPAQRKRAADFLRASRTPLRSKK